MLWSKFVKSRDLSCLMVVFHLGRSYILGTLFKIFYSKIKNQRIFCSTWQGERQFVEWRVTPGDLFGMKVRGDHFFSPLVSSWRLEVDVEFLPDSLFIINKS